MSILFKMMLRIISLFVILQILMHLSRAGDTCLTHLEKVHCMDKEKSMLHYVCHSRPGDNCSCVFDNPLLGETEWYKACHSKYLRNVRKKRVRKRQAVELNICGTIGPPRPGKVSCFVSRTDIKCNGTCDLDHEFVDGDQEKMHSCFYADGLWIPSSEFPACKPKCNPPCENGGTCQSVNFCACLNDYRGNACQYPISLCTIAKNQFASNWKCNHTRDETSCDVSCHPPDTIHSELDATRFQCSVEGTWNPELPPCVQVPLCEEPRLPTNGRWQLLVGRTLGPGSRIVYTCENGYLLQGEEFAECSRNGSWSSEAPNCVQQNSFKACGDPGDIVHGQRRIPLEGLFEGSILTYECDENFTLLGDSIMKCMENGQWSTTKPRCILKEHAPDFCPKPSAPRNSLVHVTFPDQHPLKTFFNRDISFPQWLYSINYARGGETDFASLPDRTFLVGTRVQYKCKSRFYKLYGSQYQTCQTSRTWSGYQPSCIPECGKSDSPKTPFIVNGNYTHIGQWPWQVGLAVKSNSGLNLLCGGALISETWVLTAAHCVTRRSSNNRMSPSDLLTFSGKYYRAFDKDDEYVQVKKIKQIIVHDEYDFVHYDVDIALLQLESAIELTTRVQPICLPTEDTMRENIRDGKRGIVTGWGLTENGKNSETLKETIMPVVSHDRCEEAYREGFRSVTITSNMFCAGHESGQSDTCSGDSGGPFMFAIGPANENRWYLEGIVSWGSNSGCGKSHRYSGFTKVGKFVPWINMHV